MITETVMKACPSWCAEEPDHDAEDVAKGAPGRIHRTEPVGDQQASWDDNPREPAEAWWFEPAEVSISSATAADLADGMRVYANEVLALADRIGEISAPIQTVANWDNVNERIWHDANTAAGFAGCSSETIRRACQDGTLPASKPFGRWRIHRNDLDAWLRGGTS